jgi:hypothetical protein
MTNRHKAKGDQGEREAVNVLRALAPDLVLADAQRKLGAGRKEDTGDLVVFDDVTIQVKNYVDTARALREAALGAQVQSERARTTFALGLAPIFRARTSAVRWLACVTDWPGGEPPRSELAVFGLPLRAVAHVRREDLGVRRERRIAVVERQGTPRLYVAPVEAWITAWRLARADGVQLHLFETITEYAAEHATGRALGTDLAHAS